VLGREAGLERRGAGVGALVLLRTRPHRLSRLALQGLGLAFRVREGHGAVRQHDRDVIRMLVHGGLPARRHDDVEHTYA